MSHPKEDWSAAVRLETVSFAWPKGEPVLKEISLEVNPGEMVFISGPSGGGKSTLLSLVAGIIVPKTGSITVAGIDLKSLSGAKRDKFRGERIGYIFQQFNLIPYLTPVENVLLPCRFSKVRSLKALENQTNLKMAAQTLLERLSIEPKEFNKAASKLSVGQQQRVAAARALIGQPAILIADEPTSALDAELGISFVKLLKTECEAVGGSLLFVSHDRSLEVEFSVRYVLKEGTLQRVP
ncbi:MAG: ABC transporter ATP-binding protein [Deltaproteobacteria bacterium]|jgi:putative ABC transport system ATP-binding protein|nr:ABC transporter ATP-binding protein [Deltaproteobacteria bacterium]